MNRLLINKLLECILTEETIRAFEGEIGFIKLLPFKEYGPFYRVDSGEMAIETKEANDKIIEEIILSKKILKLNITYLKTSRATKLKDYIKNISNPEKNLAESFIDTHIVVKQFNINSTIQL